MILDPEPAAPPAVDVAAFLDRVHGDAELASAMASLFLELCPHMLDDVCSAVAAQDAAAIERSAHALSGSVGNFVAPAAAAAASRMELLGRAGDIAAAPAALRTLEVELERLVPALREVIR